MNLTYSLIPVCVVCSYVLPCRALSHELRVNVIGYDYSGYGASTGVPSPSQTFADISAVYTYLTEELGVPMHRVVLYGQSVGSGPTCWLAAHEKAIGGVVLHSHIYSGLRVLYPDISYWPSWAGELRTSYVSLHRAF